MSTLIPDSEDQAAHLDYAAAEGLDAQGDPALYAPDVEADRSSWTFVAIGLVGLVALIAIARRDRRARHRQRRPAAVAAAAAPPPHADHAATADRRRADARRRQGRRRSRSSSASTRRCRRSRPAPSRSSRSTSTSTSPRSPRTSRRPRSGASPSTASTTAAPASRRRWSSTRATPSTSRSTNGSDESDEGRPAALARLPLRRGQPRHALRGPRARQVDALPLRRQAPRRVHVPLRDAAGPDAHRRGHGRHVRRQAEGPRSGRQGAVDHPAGVLHRQARRATRTWPRWPAKKPDVIAFNGYANQYKDDPIERPARARRSACTSSTPARASGAPST